MEACRFLRPLVQDLILIFFYLFLFQNLQRMEGETEEPVRDLNELENADWVRAVPLSITVLNAFRLCAGGSEQS